jgi:twitching motility protein PilT
MPAGFSLSALKQNNHNPASREKDEENRLKNLSASITQYAEDQLPPPAPEPEPDVMEVEVAPPLDQEALMAEILRQVREEHNKASVPQTAVVTSGDLAAASKEKYGSVEPAGEYSALRKSTPTSLTEPDNFPLSSIITDAYDMGASDVYIQPETPIRFKVGGGLAPYYQQPTPTRNDVSRLLEKVTQITSSTTFRAEKELDISYTIPKGKYAGRRCRLNVTYVSPGLSNINMVFRLLATDIQDPSYYNVPKSFIEALHQKAGLIVVAGVTGSGKTTTIASGLYYAQCNVTTPHPVTGEPMGVTIVTIEQPIEYLFDNNNPNSNGSLFIQREVNTDTRSFLNGIKSALRQNPNIMLIGEVRNELEIQAALRAAETGHLTLTTVHAQDCAGIIERLATNDDGTLRANSLASIASSGRVFMTQALVKRMDGGLIPAHEVLEIRQSDRVLIEDIKTGNISDIRQRLQDEGEDMCSTLMNLCRAETGPCYVKDALEHAPDPHRFLTLIRTAEANGEQFNYHPDELKNI